MSVIGIIAVPKKNKSITERVFRSAKIKESFGDNPKYIVTELPYCQEKLRLMKIRKIKKFLKNANAALKNNGADRVVFTRECREVIPQKNEDKIFVPPQKIGECVLFVHKKITAENNKTAFNSLLIHDSNLAAVTYKMLADLCGYFKNVSLCTERIGEANKICDKVFADYGICISVAERDKTKAIHPRCIYADVDAGKVYAGDFVINGIEVPADTGKYHVDWRDITCAILKDSGADFEIKNYISGKNKLKLVDNK